MHNNSPLRYPGGKARLGDYVQLVMRMNGLAGGLYIEPYAGGASVALSLLYGGHVSDVHINDIDESIYAFWYSVLNHNKAFCELVRTAELSISEWRKQREAYRNPRVTDKLERGWATFYLNRTNRSGIIGNGGAIGGQQQAGKWKLDARFPKDELIRRIGRVGALRNQIHLTSMDAVKLVNQFSASQPEKALLYLDPPYYEKGRALYTAFYMKEDHAEVAAAVRESGIPWVVSYDNQPELHDLYKGCTSRVYGLRYTARERYEGREVMFFSSGLKVPEELTDPTAISRAELRKAAQLTLVAAPG